MAKTKWEPTDAEVLENDFGESHRPTETNLLFLVATKANRTTRRGWTLIKSILPMIMWASAIVAAILAITSAVYLAAQILSMVFAFSTLLGWFIVGLLAINGCISLGTLIGVALNNSRMSTPHAA